MTCGVLVLALTLSDVGDGGLTAMWVIGETLNICRSRYLARTAEETQRTAPLPIWK